MRKKPPPVTNLADVSEEAMINNVIYMENKAHRNRLIVFCAAVLLLLIGVGGFMTLCLIVIPEVITKWLGA